MSNWKLLMLTHFSMKIITHIFGYEIYCILTFLASKFSMNPYHKWVLIEPSISTTPCYNKAEGFQNEHLKKLNELLWVSLNSMYGLKIPAGDKINPKNYDKPLDPRTPHMQKPQSLNGSFHLNVEACDRNLGLALCLPKTHK